MTEPLKPPPRIRSPRLWLKALQGLAAIAAFFVVSIAIFLLLLLLSNELQEARSARSWGGNPILIIVITMVVSLAFVALAGFVCFLLLRFAIKGPRTH